MSSVSRNSFYWFDVFLLVYLPFLLINENFAAQINEEDLSDCAVESTSEFVGDGETIQLGCNWCRCKQGRLICTRLLCSNEKSLRKHDVMGDMEQAWATPCEMCDYEVQTMPFCGVNLMTYRSFCHAHFCGRLDLDQVEYGKCSSQDPCQHPKNCKENEQCISKSAPPCLVADSSLCTSYECLKLDETECQSELLSDGPVCDTTGVTHDNQCRMIAAGAVQAYNGRCTNDGNAKVCGTDDTTLPSNAWAEQNFIPVDYIGECIPHIALETMENDPRMMEYNHRNDHCQRVYQLHRCADIETGCSVQVVPEGMCCPICGAALSIRIDWNSNPILNHPPLDGNYHVDGLASKLHAILSQTEGFEESCTVKLGLLQDGDLTLVLRSAYGFAYNAEVCKRAGQNLMKMLNSKKGEFKSTSEGILRAWIDSATIVE